MVETTLPDGLESSARRVYRKFWHISDVFEFLSFGLFFPFLIFFWFLCILRLPYCGIGATIRIGREIDVSRIRDFFSLSGEASRWSNCYQRGLPLLFFVVVNFSLPLLLLILGAFFSVRCDTFFKEMISYIICKVNYFNTKSL